MLISPAELLGLMDEAAWQHAGRFINGPLTALNYLTGKTREESTTTTTRSHSDVFC